MVATKSIDRVKILSRCEITTVLSDLQRKGKRSANSRQNAIIFRLATFCGLRVSEIVGLTLSNVRVSTDEKAHIYVPKDIAKRKKARTVPLWWSAKTLTALRDWKREREEQGATSSDPFVCSQAHGTHHKTKAPTFGKPLIVRNAQSRFQAAIKVLGKERASQLSIHCGRHSFCSHALTDVVDENGTLRAKGRSLAEVRDAAGHANIATTSIYLHTVDTTDGKVGNLFDFEP